MNGKYLFDNDKILKLAKDRQSMSFKKLGVQPQPQAESQMLRPVQFISDRRFEGLLPDPVRHEPIGDSDDENCAADESILIVDKQEVEQECVDD